MVAEPNPTSCPHCSHVLRLGHEHLGRRVACKYCGHCFRVGPKAPRGSDAGDVGLAQWDHSRVRSGLESQSRVLVAAGPSRLGGQGRGTGADDPLRSGEPDGLLPPDEDLVAESNDDHQLKVMFQNAQSIVSPMAVQPNAAPVAVAEGPATWESSSDLILIPTAIRELDTDPAPPPPELVAQLRDLVRQRDEASAE